MSPELIGIFGVGATLFFAQIAIWRTLQADFSEVRSDIGDLRERMARLEGTMDVIRVAFVELTKRA